LRLSAPPAANRREAASSVGRIRPVCNLAASLPRLVFARGDRNGVTAVTVPQPRIGVITYPGSQDDRDALWALAALDAEAVPVWHDERELPDLDAVVLPGGFSYGDYLRCGAIAGFSPATAAVREFADNGGLVLGICKGFQILCEAGLLPGALLRNESLRFVCRDVPLTVERNDLP